MYWFIPLFILISAIEIGIFIWVGGMIGPWWVVFLIFMTGVLGMSLAKYEGLETLSRARISLQNRRIPTEPILDGGFILLGALLLFSPGFLTDLFGLSLILPFSRKFFRKIIIAWLQKKFNYSTTIYK